jgi:hypothetical protein
MNIRCSVKSPAKQRTTYINDVVSSLARISPSYWDFLRANFAAFFSGDLAEHAQRVSDEPAG